MFCCFIAVMRFISSLFTLGMARFALSQLRMLYLPCCFSTYVGSYTKDVTAGLWGNGAKEVLEYANEMFPQRRIYVFDLTPSQVFYYEKIPTDIVAEQAIARKSLGEFYAYHIFSNYIVEGVTDDEPVYQKEDVYLYSKDNIEVNGKCSEMEIKK